MSFRCGGSDGLTSALSKFSAVEYFVSQLPDGNIGKNRSTLHRKCFVAHMWYALRQ